MSGAARSLLLSHLLTLLVPLLGLFGCSASQPPKPKAIAAPVFRDLTAKLPAAEPAAPARNYPVMLGIDVLEADGFAAVKGKRIGLLTHPAGVNRNGVSTIEVLRRAPGVKLMALFAAEHGLYGDAPAEAKIPSTTDKRTGLPVISLYPPKRPTKAMLANLDALVIDLQDIGTRSYTFAATMRWAMEGCFENNVEVIVLDRPNPLGGLKVDGPLLDARAKSTYVGAFRVPYVHGLTIGELARMAKEAPRVLDVPDAVRARGKLTVVPMRGWTRAMRWPETGLKFVPTSGLVQTWDAVQGYPMTGLGAYFDLRPAVNFDIGFRHGVGSSYPFRGVSFGRGVKPEVLEKELLAVQPYVPGIRFARVSVPNPKTGQPVSGLYVQIVDYDAWNPCELNFWMMKIACKLSPKNPFAKTSSRDTSGFLNHMGSQAFLDDIAVKGAAVDIPAWLKLWREQAKVYREQSRKYWLYQ